MDNNHKHTGYTNAM